VNRYFACGKGFATARQAWRVAAKAELKQIIIHLAHEIEGFEPCGHCDGTGIGYHCHSPNSCPYCKGTGCSYPTKEAFFKAYESMFPHDENGSCGISEGGKCAETGCYEDHGTQYHGETIWLADGLKYSWCKTAYRKWLDAKILELQTQPKLMEDAA